MRIKKTGSRIGFCRTTSIAHYNGSATTDRKKELKRTRQVIRNRVIYRLRQTGVERQKMLFNNFFIDFPRRMLRGLIKTPSSQPPSAVFKAYWDLLIMGGRLISRVKDNELWNQYLKGIGWPDNIPGFRPEKLTHKESGYPKASAPGSVV